MSLCYLHKLYLDAIPLLYLPYCPGTGGEGERGRGTAGQAAPPTGQDHQPHHAADQGTENVS
jgi:hypothetical protein